MNGLVHSTKLDISVNSWEFLSQTERYRREWKRVHSKAPKLLPHAARRQMQTASEILNRLRGQFGLLLADDVGLGKTLIAVLVAGVFAGTGKRVRILAPNETMRRKWEHDTKEHFAVLARFAHLAISPQCVKGSRLARLHGGRVQMTTHAKASLKTNLACDLLIVDEAHRARGENTLFRKELESQRRKGTFNRVLFLTATPFSIDHRQLVNMLKLIGASVNDRRRVRTFGNLLDAFWGNGRSFSQRKWEQKIRQRREEAISAMKPWVIRHSVEELRDTERAYFGEKDEKWSPKIPTADDSILEVLLRTDRMLRLGRREQLTQQKRTNDPRFHVGWNHLQREVNTVRANLESDRGPANDQPTNRALLDLHVQRITTTLQHVGEHPKVAKIADEIARVVEQEQEKVLVFCHHHATAAEIANSLNERLPAIVEKKAIKRWLKAWQSVLGSPSDGYNVQRIAFAKWLCRPAFVRQILRWVRPVLATDAPWDVKVLAEALETARPRGDPDVKVAEAARRLFDSLGPGGSKSTREVLRRAAKEPFIAHLPNQRVVALADPGDTNDQTAESRLFYRGQPDTIMAIFNSPFGPEVLVTTDRLSEGVDLHRYCRHIVHYELSPSPIRVLQRNGRVRRLGSWASRTHRPIRIAYPQFRGTRDERLVEIVKGRLERFDLLLGGAGSKVEEALLDQDERWKYKILEKLPEVRGPLSVV